MEASIYARNPRFFAPNRSTFGLRPMPPLLLFTLSLVHTECIIPLLNPNREFGVCCLNWLPGGGHFSFHFCVPFPESVAYSCGRRVIFQA